MNFLSVLVFLSSIPVVSEVQIAPVSRRIYAEILDFIFLYLTKILVFSI